MTTNRTLTRRLARYLQLQAFSKTSRSYQKTSKSQQRRFFGSKPIGQSDKSNQNNKMEGKMDTGPAVILSQNTQFITHLGA
jgi:hypothetical protein